MTEEEKWNNYFYKGTNILKNKLNIRDNEKLKEYEYLIVAKKNSMLYLENNYPKVFDKEYLKYIHKYLFGDIYYFAGKFRNVDMGKGFMYEFTPVSQIENSLDELFNYVNNNLIKTSSSDMFYAENLAKFYKRLIQIHPFREGNGRVSRELLREYVEINNVYFDKDYYLDFNLDDNDLKILERVPREEKYGNLTLVFYNILKSKVKNKKM